MTASTVTETTTRRIFIVHPAFRRTIAKAGGLPTVSRKIGEFMVYFTVPIAVA